MTHNPDLQQTVASKAAAIVSGVGTYGGSGTALVGIANSEIVIAWVGVVIGVAGLALSWWHKRAMQRIERERLDWDKSRAG
ncbi:holin [Chachezhania sediminis]|uniref:holin n=1 Tax=Chachezhania sediminis TaxID=2599291 RepID=UPI00131C4E37|nr:holin [Chachezhania sediminis]